jgi:ubiquitin-activating enzyme E1
LIIGLRGLGIEIAKNIILNGCEEVSIYDPNLVKINDLCSNFYLTEKDVGKKRRDEACIQQLSELNPYIKISTLDIEQKSDINEYIKLFCDKVKNFNVIVITELQTMYFIAQIDTFCRQNNIKLIYSFCLGLAGYTFVDFGMTHIITDENGEETGSYLIKSISKDEEGTVVIDNVQGTNNLNIGDGDYVKFKDVGGMVELNDDNKEFQIRLENFQTFKIGDTSKFSEYTKGGIAYQIKHPVIKQYFDFGLRSAIISDPMHPFNIPDYTKKGRQELLYIILTGIHDFFVSHGNKLPELNNMTQAKEICEKVKQMYDMTKDQKIPWFSEIQDFDEKVVMNVIRWSAANIQPICGFFGGIIAQEIIKATGKYIPIDQWFIQDFLEIADNIKEDADRSLKNCRYDDQIAIFGNEIQEKIKKSNIFMIGAGATGCEFLKNFGMMGFCTDKNAKFVVTDNDNIEISNLSRQFLFRRKDVGKPKSVVAINSVKKMNPEFNGEGLQLKVCPETENIFNEDFWSKQDFIIFAVDSAEARNYIDSKIIYFQKPAIDSGTLGIKAKSQVIIPHQTLTYADTKSNTPTQITKIPVCTLRHFPSMIQHCIEWSRDCFSGYFGDKINSIKLFFADYNAFKQDIRRKGSPKYQLDTLNDYKIFIDMIVKKDLKKMCEYAVDEYTKNFDHKIQHLLISYPPDYKDKNGADFWVGSKRLPHPIPYNPDDDLCLEYVYKLVYILSHALNIEFSKEELNKENVRKISREIKIKEMPKDLVKIDINKEEEEEKKKEEGNQPIKINEQLSIEEMEKNSEIQKQSKEKLEEIFKELDSIKRENYDPKKISPEEFEKDHDENGHIDFIHAGANLRARNYKIDECDRNKTKKIAGKIIPTVLTTTAAIAGIASMQLYTLFQTKERKYFRNSFLNLSNCFCFFSEPSEPVKMVDSEYSEKLRGPMKAIPEGWNIWDVIEIKGPKTCGELIDDFKKKYNVDIDMLAGNGEIFLNIMTRNESTKKKLELNIEKLYEESKKKKIEKNYLLIQLFGNVKNVKIGEKTFEFVSAYIPPIKYYFK